MLACFNDAPFKILLSWMAAASLIGFAAMGVDKGRAVGRESRIPESALFAESFVGGFLGIILGAVVFHHKTSKLSFMLVAFLTLGVWAVLLQELGLIRCLAGVLDSLRG